MTDRMAKKHSLPLLKCDRCDYSTKNRYIYQRHRNRCKTLLVPGLKYVKNKPVAETEFVEKKDTNEAELPKETKNVENNNTIIMPEAPLIKTTSKMPKIVLGNKKKKFGSKMPKFVLRAGKKSSAISKKLPKLGLGATKKASAVAVNIKQSRGQKLRNYRCNDCEFTATKSRPFLYHQINVHFAKFSIFPCDECDYVCKWKHKLLRHIKMVHHRIGNSDDYQPENGDGTELSESRVAKVTTPTISTVTKPKSTPVMKTIQKVLPEQPKVRGTKAAAAYIVDVTQSEDNPQFKCKLCLYNSETRARVASHVMGCHINAKEFSCTICGFNTTNKLDFYVHKAKHKSQKIFSCTECSYATAFKPNFDRHMVNHDRQFRYKCMICNYTSDHEGALKRHTMYNHSNDNQNISLVSTDADISLSFMSPNASETSYSGRMDSDDDDAADDSSVAYELLPGFYRCEHCGFLGMSEQELEDHVSTHKRVAFYPCQICKLKYKRSSDLNRHMKLKHKVRLKDFINRQGTKCQIEIDPTGFLEDSDACSIDSQMRPSSANDMEDEVDGKFRNLHGDEDDNEIQFRTQNEDEPLDLSMGSPSKLEPIGEPLKCTFCSYMAKWPSDLRRHMVVHSIEKRFKCPECFKKYKYVGDLNVHLRRDHKMEPDSNTKIQKVPVSPVRKSSQGMFRCVACPYTSRWKSEVERHSRCHTDAKPHHCILCDYQSHWKGDVKRHLCKHHPEVMKSEVPVEDFIETADNEPLCLGEDEEEYSLMPPPPKSASKSQGGKGKGGKSANSAASLSMEQMELEEMLSGEDSKLTGLSPSAANANSPSKEPVFKCKYCEFTASAPSKLKAHVITHVNLKQWKCPVCPRRSNWKWDVRKHLVKDHPGNVHMKVIMLTEEEAAATIQDYLSTSTMPKRENHLNNLNITEAQDELKFPYRCSLCSYCSSFRWEVSKHIRMEHPGQNGSVLVAFSTETSENENSPMKSSPMTSKKHPSPVQASPQTNKKQPSPIHASPKRPSPKQSPTESNFLTLSDKSRKRTRSKKADEELKSKPYMCGECGKRCILSGDIKKHYNYIHPEKVARIIYLGESDEPPAKAATPSPDPRNTAARDVAVRDEKYISLETKYNNPKKHGYIKPFQCSVCWRRSNWKWDINKHMRESHPGTDYHLVILSEEEARSTLASYIPPSQMNSMARARQVQAATQQKPPDAAPPKPAALAKLTAQKPTHSPLKRFFRDLKQFKCSVCGYRSDWRSDILRHLKNRHPRGRAELIRLDHDQARVTIKQYLANRTKWGKEIQPPGQQGQSSRRSSTENNSTPVVSKRSAETKQPPASTSPKGCLWKCSKCAYSNKERRLVFMHLRVHKIKPFTCKVCGHASNHRSAMYRHLRVKHGSARNDYSLCEFGLQFDKDGTLDLEEVDEENMTMEELEALEMQEEENRLNDEDFEEGIEGDDLTAQTEDAKKVFECKQCDFQTTWRSCMTRHLSEQHDSTDFINHCNMKVVKFAQKTPGRKKYNCIKCPYRTEKPSLLKFHMSYHKPQPGNRYKCKYCPYYVCAKRLLHQHLRIHAVANGQTPTKKPTKACFSNTPKKYNCEKCPFKTGSKNDFLYHKQFHRPKPTATFKCDYCDYWVTHRRLLKQHSRVHQEAATFNPQLPSKALSVTSSPCKSEATDASWFYNPIDAASVKQQVISSKIIRSLSNGTGCSPMKQSGSPSGYMVRNGVFKKLHRCRFCPYANVRGRNQRLHEKMHGWRVSDKPLFKCVQCDYHVGSKGLLSHHMKVHSKGYGVDPMDNTMAEMENLEGVHVDTDEHSDRSSEMSDLQHDVNRVDALLEIARFKKYACEKCPYASAKRNHFERHLELHGSKQRYLCDYCDYSVPSNNLLVQHQKLHMLPNQNLLAVQSVSNLQHLPEVTADVAVATFLSAFNPVKEQTINVTHDHMELYENHPDEQEPKKLYRCDRCPYANVRRDHLLAHLKFHMIRSELTCPYCDYSVSKQHLLTQHIKVHFSPLPELSEWLAQSGIKDRDKNEDVKDDVDANDNSVEKKEETTTPGDKSDSIESSETKPSSASIKSENDETKEGNVVEASNKEHSQLTAAGTSEKRGHTETTDSSTTGKETKAVVEPAEPSTSTSGCNYICQYCDREFVTSGQLLCHEMQHLVGNHFETNHVVELPSPVNGGETIVEKMETEEEIAEAVAMETS